MKRCCIMNSSSIYSMHTGWVRYPLWQELEQRHNCRQPTCTRKQTYVKTHYNHSFHILYVCTCRHLTRSAIVTLCKHSCEQFIIQWIDELFCKCMPLYICYPQKHSRWTCPRGCMGQNACIIVSTPPMYSITTMTYIELKVWTDVVNEWNVFPWSVFLMVTNTSLS